MVTAHRSLFQSCHSHMWESSTEQIRSSAVVHWLPGGVFTLDRTTTCKDLRGVACRRGHAWLTTKCKGWESCDTSVSRNKEKCFFSPSLRLRDTAQRKNHHLTRRNSGEGDRGCRSSRSGRTSESAWWGQRNGPSNRVTYLRIQLRRWPVLDLGSFKVNPEFTWNT